MVKFNNEYIAEKILSRALKLKDYVGHYGEKCFSVFISKSLTPSEREMEKLILTKRRQLINEGKDVKKIKIRNFELFYDSNKIEIKESN